MDINKQMRSLLSLSDRYKKDYDLADKVQKTESKGDKLSIRTDKGFLDLDIEDYPELVPSLNKIIDWVVKTHDSRQRKITNEMEELIRCRKS